MRLLTHNLLICNVAVRSHWCPRACCRGGRQAAVPARAPLLALPAIVAMRARSRPSHPCADVSGRRRAEFPPEGPVCWGCDRGQAVRPTARVPPSQVVVAEGGVRIEDTPVAPPLIAHLLTKLEWPVFRDTAREVRAPPSPPPALLLPSTFLSSPPLLVVACVRCCCCVSCVFPSPPQVGGAAVALPDEVPADAASDDAFIAAVQPPWASDEFATLELRAKQIGRVYGLLGETFLQRTTAEWLELLQRLNIPCSPLRSTDELFENPQLQEIGFFETLETPTGPVTFPGVPSWFSKTPGKIAGPAPTLGEHTEEVLRELGLKA